MAIIQQSTQNISTTTPQPIVGQVLVQKQSKKNDVFYSSSLLNYIESFEIDGISKTVFFTEVNTNVNVGDRVFIINGNYDSNEYINGYKYKRKSDGYKVLSVDGCRLILDIDFNGQLPYEKLTTKNFILIHHVETQKDFDYINTLKYINDSTQGFVSKFGGEVIQDYLSLDGQNILFAETNFSGKTVNSTKIYSGVGGKGFWIKNLNGDWMDVTDEVLLNLIKTNPRFEGVGNIYIVGKTIEYQNFKFESGTTYKYEKFTWIKDVRYSKPYLSKLNFRFGKFSGKHNDGVFGSLEKRCFWNNSIWNNGVFLNSDWNGGIMDSKHTLEEESYSARVESYDGLDTVIQNSDSTNNRGFGYNFIEKSNFFTFSISNGNFYDCLFERVSPYRSALDLYYFLSFNPFYNVLNGGKYEYCDVYDLRANNSYFLNSSIENINLRSSKIISSEVINSSILNSSWSGEGGIKILSAELGSYDKNPLSILGGPASDVVGILKLFISEEDYFKLSRNDTFHISKLNKDVILSLLTEEQKILMNIESRYIIDNYDDYDLDGGSKKELEISLSSSYENSLKPVVGVSNQTNNIYGYVIDGENPFLWYRIDPNYFLGAYSQEYSVNVGYNLNEITYDGTNFYQFVPYDRNILPIVSRASDNQQAKNFVSGFESDGIVGINGISDWLLIGNYTGKWSEDGVYQGSYIEEITSPYQPRFASGSIVSDGEDLFNSNNIWIFVGQYQTGYSSAFFAIGVELLLETDNLDGSTSNAYLRKVIKVEYKSVNQTIQSKSLPSIDIYSDLFGFYIDANQQYTPTNKNKIKPINSSNVERVFKDTILVNGDFKSGTFENSTWLRGDHTNYQHNLIKKLQTNDNLDIQFDFFDNKKIVKVNIQNKRFSTLYDYKGYDYVVGDYVWLRSIFITSGADRYPIDGRYKVVKYSLNLQSSSSELWLLPTDPTNTINTIPSGDFSTIQAKTNNYLSVHKSNFENSKISSGKLRRSGLHSCTIENESFQKYIRPADNIQNTELLRLVNIMMNNNILNIRSGLVYKSHFVSGVFNGGIFYDSIWLGNSFEDGLFKSSVWTGGDFNGGQFVDSRDTKSFTFDFDTSNNIKLWQGGNFNGGEFYNSLWVKGTFNNGRFYFSDWTGGVWNNGTLGSKNLRVRDTTMAFYIPRFTFGATHTVWYNGLVENATIGGSGSIDWYGGRMISGEFTSYDRRPATSGFSYANYAIWHDGEFYGSSFTNKAWWKSGKFYSGKFLSDIGWTTSNFLTHSTNNQDYGWVDGYFYGGEFGNGSTQSNSIWYTGVMDGGVFQGRFWRDGVLVGGKFYGSLDSSMDVYESMLAYTNSFYGLWENGQVNNILNNVKTEIIYTTEETQSNPKNFKFVAKKVDMVGVLWKHGTFSHEVSTFDSSVWLDGTFNNGNFINSHFNPFVDLNLVGLGIEGYKKIVYIKNLYVDIQQYVSLFANSSIQQVFQLIQNRVNQLNSDATIPFKLKIFSTTLIPASTAPIDLTQVEYFDTTPKISSNSTLLLKIFDEELLNFLPDEYIAVRLNSVLSFQGIPPRPVFSRTGTSLYPNVNKPIDIPFSYNLSDTCVWNNGNFNGLEFNYSVWKDGNFNDGSINGAIWKKGTFNYGTANNILWEDGIWRNGNWNGSPFDYSNLEKSSIYWLVTDLKAKQLLNNIRNYTNIDKIHLSNVVVSKGSTKQIHKFDASGFGSWSP